MGRSGQRLTSTVSQGFSEIAKLQFQPVFPVAEPGLTEPVIGASFCLAQEMLISKTELKAFISVCKIQLIIMGRKSPRFCIGKISQLIFKQISSSQLCKDRNYGNNGKVTC